MLSDDKTPESRTDLNEYLDGNYSGELSSRYQTKKLGLQRPGGEEMDFTP